MSFSKLPYDSCAYDKQLQESVSVGAYMLNTPKVNSKQGMFFDSPYVRLDKNSVAHCKNKSLIDVDSELLGLNMKNTKCLSERLFDSEYCKNAPLTSGSEASSFMSPEDTKLSNPPCTLRGTGWNRWEWLCEDPQRYAILPFETNIQNRIVVKDNHRPCLPNIKDSNDVLPKNKDDSCYTDKEIKNMYEEKAAIPFVHWRSCDEIRKL
jgi:hypothetical protein